MQCRVEKGTAFQFYVCDVATVYIIIPSLPTVPCPYKCCANLCDTLLFVSPLPHRDTCHRFVSQSVTAKFNVRLGVKVRVKLSLCLRKAYAESLI
jgi:hypothetical protein